MNHVINCFKSLTFYQSIFLWNDDKIEVCLGVSTSLYIRYVVIWIPDSAKVPSSSIVTLSDHVVLQFRLMYCSFTSAVKTDAFLYHCLKSSMRIVTFTDIKVCAECMLILINYNFRNSFPRYKLNKADSNNTLALFIASYI